MKLNLAHHRDLDLSVIIESRYVSPRYKCTLYINDVEYTNETWGGICHANTIFLDI